MIINNDPCSIWTVKECETFTKKFDENTYRTVYQGAKEYFTTFYADFGFEVPEGCKAYAVTDIKALEEGGLAGLTEFDGVVPAQTPVLLMSTETTAELKLSLESGSVPEGNLLKGTDYLIDKYSVTTPQVEGLFEMAKSLLGETSELYQNLVNEYGHLMMRNAGTVNNKYFFGLDVEKDLENQFEDSPIRTLGKEDDILAFSQEWGKINSNEAFLDNEEYNPIKLPVWPDVNRDGEVDIHDVTALIDIVLFSPEVFEQYDYDAADVNRDCVIDVNDVTMLIDIVLFAE